MELDSPVATLINRKPEQETRKTFTWVGKEFVPEQNPETPAGKFPAPPPSAPLEGWSPDQPRPVGRPALHDNPEPVDLTAHFNDRVTEIFRPGKYLSPRSPFVSLALPSQGLGREPLDDDDHREGEESQPDRRR